MFTARRFTFPWFLNWGVFLLCVGLSGTFAVELYTGLVDDFGDKTLLGIGAGVVEGLKILTLIVANTALFLATNTKMSNLEAYRKGQFKYEFWKDSTDFDFVALAMRYGKLVQTYVRMFILYGFFALITFTGSFGFVLTHIALRGQSHVIVATTDVQGAQADQIQANRDAIAQNKKTIAQNNADIDILNGKIKKLEADATLTDEDRAKKEAPLQSKVDSLTRQNTSLATKDTELAGSNTTLAGDNVKLKTQDKTVENSVKKDMYDLMSDAFGHGISADAIRSILLSLFATGIELGLFFFSPHFRSLEDTLTIVAARSSTPVEPVAPVAPVPAPAKPHRLPEEQKIAFAPTPLPVAPAPVPSPLTETVAEAEEALEEDAGDVVPEVEALAHPEPAEPVAAEVPATPEVQSPPDPTLRQIMDFLDALFPVNGEQGKATIQTAVMKSGIALPLAKNIFSFLSTHKREGQTLVVFNSSNGQFYPRFALPVLKEEVGHRFAVPTSEGTKKS